MTLYENSNDRNIQELARVKLERHMNNLGIGLVQIRHTPQERTELWDLDVHVNGMYVGVAEVKGCGKPYSEMLEKGFGFLIKTRTLSGLKEMFYRSKVDGSKYHRKEVAILHYCIPDDRLFAVSMRTLITNGKRLKATKPGVIKENHGATDSDEPGLSIPTDLYTEIS